jgi:hypothetical protein
VFGNGASGDNHEGSLCLTVSDTSLFIIIANSVLWQCAQSVKVRFTCGSAELHSSQDMATHQTCRSFLCAVFVCVICQMMCIVKMDMCFARFRAFDIKNNAKVHPAGGIVGSDTGSVGSDNLVVGSDKNGLSDPTSFSDNIFVGSDTQDPTLFCRIRHT